MTTPLSNWTIVLAGRIAWPMWPLRLCFPVPDNATSSGERDADVGLL